MKNILHPDYWVEIPAGEFLTGLSQARRLLIGQNIRTQVNYENFSAQEQHLVETIVAKIQQRAEQKRREGKIVLGYPLELSEDERLIQSVEPFNTIINLEHSLLSIPAQTSVLVDRYYIARFPITRHQYGKLQTNSLARVRGALEEPYFERKAAVVSGNESMEICEQLGARLPTVAEWEKAARGTDGRLYPWGDDWDATAGYFYYGQYGANPRRVDAYPRGVSPYGVWSMAGGLPELVKRFVPFPHESWKGCHARESSPEMAWFDHITAKTGNGQWVSLRPVLDQWPRRQWPGFQVGLDEPDAEKLQRMGLLADLVITQFDWVGYVDKDMRATLYPAIVALRDGNKAEALTILDAVLTQYEDSEPIWLLKAAAMADVVQQQACIQQALVVNPDSEVGQKMAAFLEKSISANSHDNEAKISQT